MKKRFLLVLAVLVLMCTVVFAAGAADCGDGNHSLASRTVYPTCTTQGYDEVYCPACGKSLGKTNWENPLDHVWKDGYVLDESGDYYQNDRVCQRVNCGATETQNVNGTEVKYYMVEFINAKSFKSGVEKITAKNGAEITMKHTVLAAETEQKAMYTQIVKEGGAVTYKGDLPVRTKDVDYGRYNFRGWVTDISKDTNGFDYKKPEQEINSYKNNESYIPRDISNYDLLTVTDVTKNTKYYAAWETEDVYYTVTLRSDGKDWLTYTNVKHGSTVTYDFIYPSKASSVSTDYKFTGWGIGVNSSDKAQYDIYDATTVNIKHIPIYSGDTFVANYESVPRVYQTKINKVAESNIVYNIPYGTLIGSAKDGDNWKVSFGNVGKVTVPNEYTDNTYAYTYKGYFKTASGSEMQNGTFNVPLYTLDCNDSIFPVYTDNLKTKLSVNGKEMVLLEEVDDGLKPSDYQYGGTEQTLFYCFQQEMNYYNQCVANKVLYEPKVFDLNNTTYLYLVSEHGDYVYDENGNKVTLEISLNGIYLVDIIGNRAVFTKADAEELRTVEIEPAYSRLVKKHRMRIEVYLPVVINGTTIEATPEYYLDKVAVQITNENGHLLARGTSNEGKLFTDSKGNTYYLVYCNLDVQKAERYHISAASVDNNEKYYGERTLYWSTYENMDGGSNQRPVISVDAGLSDGYNNSTQKCNCICHNGILKGLWVRVLNILYNLFKVQYECCPHMHAELGDLLAY